MFYRSQNVRKRYPYLDLEKKRFEGGAVTPAILQAQTS